MSFLGRSVPMSFPTYILPSLPFRRKDSSDSTRSTSSNGDEPSAPRDVLPGHTSLIRCATCAAELCLTSQVVSRGFTGRYGAAYLVSPLDDDDNDSNSGSPTTDGARATMTPAQLRAARRTRPLPNTGTLQVMRRNFVTGGHTVCDVICHCGAQVGWKYINADEESQRYKIGKFILETKLTTVSARWEDGAGAGADAMVGGRRLGDLMRPATVDGEDVEFDSQDEEECEDLFMGLWTPEQALKRRRAKMLVAR